MVEIVRLCLKFTLSPRSLRLFANQLIGADCDPVRGLARVEQLFRTVQRTGTLDCGWKTDRLRVAAEISWWGAPGSGTAPI